MLAAHLFLIADFDARAFTPLPMREVHLLPWHFAAVRKSLWIAKIVVIAEVELGQNDRASNDDRNKSTTDVPPLCPWQEVASRPRKLNY